MKYAVIIKHPFRDWDWRVDIVDSELSAAEVRQSVEASMLGPFEVVSVTDRLDLDRKLSAVKIPQSKIE